MNFDTPTLVKAMRAGIAQAVPNPTVKIHRKKDAAFRIDRAGGAAQTTNGPSRLRAIRQYTGTVCIFESE